MNIRNTKRFVKHTYKKHRKGVYIPIMFVGASGAGKTQVMNQIGDEIKNESGLKDFRVVNYRLSQKEQGDLVGNPIEVEMVPCPYCVENGIDDFHHDVLHEKKKLMEHIHKAHEELKGKYPTYSETMDIIRTRYSHLIEIRTGNAIPDQLPLDGHGIFHLDEINRATKGVRDAVFELVLERRLGNYVLPPGWIIVSSINPPSDEYIVHELDGAMVRRFCQIRFNPEHEEFMSYAANMGLEDKVRQFVGEYPQFLGNDPVQLPYEPKPCPRTVEMMANLIDGLDEDLIYEVAAGLIGKEAATSFMTMQKSKERPIPAKKILKDYDSVKTKIDEYSNKKRNRADLLRITIDDMIILLEKNESSLEEHEKKNMIKFIMDIPKDLAVGMIKLMIQSENYNIQKLFAELSKDESLRKYILEKFHNIYGESL